MLRRLAVLAPSLLLLAAGAADARASEPFCASSCTAAPAGSGPLFILAGHGWGHGVGMSQYGAYGYAQHGWTYQQILSHYYPGTTLGQAPISSLRVLLAEHRKALTISSQADFHVRDGSGADYPLPAGSYKLGPTLNLVLGNAPPKPLPPPLTFEAGSAPLSLGRPYRGSIVVDVVGGKLRAINVVGLEQYLDGVVPSEMPDDWAPEALKAQAVAARSYALATRAVAAPFDVYADSRSQIYLGLSNEQPSTTAAVNATAGQVLLYGGNTAETFFYSTSGGRTANVSDVFSSIPPLPYLVSVNDPYDVISPYHNWGPVVFTAKKLTKAFHVPGGVDDVRTTTDASGRVATLALLGVDGEVDVPGTTVRTTLRLRSTWFDIGVLSLAQPKPAGAVEFGSAIQLAGLDRGVGPVALEQRPRGSSWQQLQLVQPDANGTVTVTARPSISTDYRLATPDAAAAPVRVPVSPRIRFVGTTAKSTLRGLVRPVLPDASVQIQRQDTTSGTWTVVALGTVDGDGNFAVPLRLSAGVYRARVAPGHGFVAGTTPPLRVEAG